MKFVEKNEDENSITIIPQHPDDLYTLYNIIMTGDWITSKSSRRIKREEGGSDSSNRVTVFISIKVESTEFHGFGDIIRVRGKIVRASETNITIGSYHTLKIELYKKVEIKKKQKWRKYDLQSLDQSIVGETSGIILVSIDDESAIIALVGSHATKILLELWPTIPRKSSDPKQHKDATITFYNELSKFVRDKLQEGIAKTILLGGPGFTKDSYIDYIKLEYPKLVSKFKIFQLQSSGVGGINELIRIHLPEGLDAVQVTKLHSQLVTRFFEEIGKDTGLVAYGQHVFEAATMGAIEELLIVDTLLRGSVDERNKMIELIETVKNSRGRVNLISSMHSYSELLKGFNGLVAILRYKIR